MTNAPHEHGTRQWREILDLNDYRELVSLDVPFRPPPAARADERETLLAELLNHLDRDGTAAQLGANVSSTGPDYESRQDLLRALLTIRDPRPLPESCNVALDRLLQHGRALRGTVESSHLPRIGDVAASRTSPASAQTALWQGDITTLRVDAIVNAANDRLLGCFIPFHACIDNAIHWAAGPRLRADCDRIMQVQGTREPVGVAKATRAYNLPSRYVLHTVGPTVRGPLRAEHEHELAACYEACLNLAARLDGVRSVAICAVSTGIFGFPKRPAAQIALQTVGSWLSAHPGTLDLVVFNVFGDDDYRAYRDAIHH
jgi:O-acetyl-ADP-ribose deacetylase (regulator of RNase III)